MLKVEAPWEERSQLLSETITGLLEQIESLESPAAGNAFVYVSLEANKGQASITLEGSLLAELGRRGIGLVVDAL